MLIYLDISSSAKTLDYNPLILFPHVITEMGLRFITVGGQIKLLTYFSFLASRGRGLKTITRPSSRGTSGCEGVQETETGDSGDTMNTLHQAVSYYQYS